MLKRSISRSPTMTTVGTALLEKTNSYNIVLLLKQKKERNIPLHILLYTNHFLEHFAFIT